MTPRVISGCPNFALSDAIIISHIMANSQPPPRAYPETAATWGWELRGKNCVFWFWFWFCKTIWVSK